MSVRLGYWGEFSRGWIWPAQYSETVGGYSGIQPHTCNNQYMYMCVHGWYVPINTGINISSPWQKNHSVFVIAWLLPPCMSPTSTKHRIQPPSSGSGVTFIVVVLGITHAGAGTDSSAGTDVLKGGLPFWEWFGLSGQPYKYEIIMPNSRQSLYQLTASFLAFPPLSVSFSGLRKIKYQTEHLRHNLFTMVLLLVFSSVNHREEPPLKQGDEPNTKEKNSQFIAYVQSQNKINNTGQKAMKQGGDFTCAEQAGLFSLAWRIHHKHPGT